MSAPNRWLIVGGFLGAIGGAGLTAVALRRNHPTVITPPSFTVESNGVVLSPHGSVTFETRPAVAGDPIAPPPVTARVLTVESRTSASFAPLEGRVTEVAIRAGDKVKQGTRLVLVSSGDLATLHRELHAAELAVRTKQAMVDRLQLLVESRAASANDLLVARSELEEAVLARTSAAARIRSLAVAEADATGYWVLANRDGTVIQLEATRGKEVGPDKDRPVATVADLDEVVVIADLPQRDTGSLAVGAPVGIRRPGSDALLATGTIERVSDAIDAERQTVPVRVRVPNPDHALRAHEFVEATFMPTPGARVIVVPSEAIVSDGASSVVFVEEKPGQLRKRPIVVGRQTRDQAEVQKGLGEGERVVVRGALLLLSALNTRP